MSKINYLFNLVGQSQSDIDAIINNQTLYVIATDDKNIQFSENYIPYTIKFMDGDDTILTIVGETGMEVQIPSNPNKEGYIFQGWSTDGIHVTSPISNIGDTDIIYKAIWTLIIVATFNVDSSSMEVKICNSTSAIQSIKVDGIELETINTNYTFNSIGNHEIIYILTDPTQISDSLFYGCSRLTSITIPDSVTSIGNNVFQNCRELTNITIPDSVISIGTGAFAGCSILTTITIPDSVTSIGSGVFEGCSGLISVTIPDSVTSIGGGAFKDCSELTSVTIGNRITSIPDAAFYECTNLNSITIPDSVTGIGARAFYNCSGLTSVTIGNSVTFIDIWAFYNCSRLTSIIIPDSVTSIYNYAFVSCYELTSVIIGNSVTSIGNSFGGCEKLTSITCNATTAPAIQNSTFHNVWRNGTLTVPSGSTGYDAWMQRLPSGWTLVEQ